MSQGTSTSKTSPDPATLQAQNATLKTQVEQLTHQLDWFKRQLFGRKSERRIVDPDPNQPLLNGFETEPSASAEAEQETVSYQRRKAKRRDDDCVTEQGFGFGFLRRSTSCILQSYVSIRRSPLRPFVCHSMSRWSVRSKRCLRR
jgi:hypothetical protein